MANFNSSIFRAYDIRGIYGSDFDDKFAFELGKKIASFLNADKLIVGRDARSSSQKLEENIIKGIRETGTKVISLGLCSTPLFYYAVNLLDGGGGIMITASHNPKEYNGFKIVKDKAEVIEGKVLKEIFYNTEDAKGKKAEVSKKDVTDDYVSRVIELSNIQEKPEVKVVVDTGNGMSGPAVNKILEKIRIPHISLFSDLDGSFPNRNPNPLVEESQKKIREEIKKTGYDLGAMFDADGDRILFFDEKGNPVSADYILLLAVQQIEKPKVVYDLRMSRIVLESISLWKGDGVASKTGHTFMKQAMKSNNADIGGELSGHFFFKEFYFNEAPELLLLKVINIINKEKKTLSELIKPFQKYFHSGEINFELTDQNEKTKILNELKEKYKDVTIDELDGITVIYENWWFNLRPSNTEPLVRLVVEADTEDLMEDKIKEVGAIIKKAAQ